MPFQIHNLRAFLLLIVSWHVCKGQEPDYTNAFCCTQWSVFANDGGCNACHDFGAYDARTQGECCGGTDNCANIHWCLPSPVGFCCSTWDENGWYSNGGCDACRESYAGYYSPYGECCFDGVCYGSSWCPNNTAAPSIAPTTGGPSFSPTPNPTGKPSAFPTLKPTSSPVTNSPTKSPITSSPATLSPTTLNPSSAPTGNPTLGPVSLRPSTTSPSKHPTTNPTGSPSTAGPVTISPTNEPTPAPTTNPATLSPSTEKPTGFPSLKITYSPSSEHPTSTPTKSPSTEVPSAMPTQIPSSVSTLNPTIFLEYDNGTESEEGQMPWNETNTTIKPINNGTVVHDSQVTNYVSIGGIAIMGICLVTLMAIAIAAAMAYYFCSRMRAKHPKGFNQKL